MGHIRANIRRTFISLIIELFKKQATKCLWLLLLSNRGSGMERIWGYQATRPKVGRRQRLIQNLSRKIHRAISVFLRNGIYTLSPLIVCACVLAFLKKYFVQYLTKYVLFPLAEKPLCGGFSSFYKVVAYLSRRLLTLIPKPEQHC